MIEIKEKPKHLENWHEQPSPLSEAKLNQALFIAKDVTNLSKKTIKHSHEWVQFVYTKTGIVYVEVGGKFWHLPPLHGVWIPKNEPHTFWSIEKSEYIAVNINDLVVKNMNRIVCKTVEISNLIDCYSMYLMNFPQDNTVQLNVKEKAFIELLLELKDVNFTLPYPMSESFIILCREIQCTPDLPHTPEECAEKLNISLSTFTRKFKKETGMTYQVWRQKMRLLISIEQLAKGNDVLNIALDIGYSSASAYIYAFKKNFGVSPMKFISNK